MEEDNCGYACNYYDFRDDSRYGRYRAGGRAGAVPNSREIHPVRITDWYSRSYGTQAARIYLPISSMRGDLQIITAAVYRVHPAMTAS